MRRKDWLLGIDAGTDSIGWAAFRLERGRQPVALLAGGVRLFDGGRDPAPSNKFYSLNRERGLLRRNRRRLRAKTWRRDRLKEYLTARGSAPPNHPAADVWDIRARAATEPVSGTDLASALLHMARHRGFKSGRLAEQSAEENSERGRKANRSKAEKPRDGVEADAAEEQARWEAIEKQFLERMKVENAPTVGALVARDLRTRGYVRARRGEGDVPTRNLIREEFGVIRKMQQPFAGLSAADWDTIEDLIFNQRPLGDPIVGRCTFYPDEPRLAKAMPSAQQFVMRQALCNLRLATSGFETARPLDQKQFNALRCILERGGEHSFAELRRAIEAPRGAYFTIERLRRPGVPKRASVALAGDETTALLASLLPTWTSLALPGRDMIVSRLLNLRRERRQLLAVAAELGATDAEKLADAVQFGLPRGRLSLGETAVGKVLRELVAGVDAHVAFERALGRSHSNFVPKVLLNELPYYGKVLQGRVSGGTGNPTDGDERRYGKLGNVTVHIALNEIRKIVNDLTARYGGPALIVIETTRELKANTMQLREIDNKQRAREKDNEAADKDIAEANKGSAAHATASRRDRLRRWRLAKRQGNVCPYTGQMIGRADLWTATYEFDHIIPLTRGGTNSEDNLVLCVAGSNREKRNKTPWEAWHSEPIWPSIRREVEKLPEKMHWRFAADAAAKVAEDDELSWAPRQIRDTSYIARVAVEYLRHVAPDVVASRGALTAYLRAAWQLPKDKHDQRRHFVDAAVIAMTNRALVQKVNTLHARGPFTDTDGTVRSLPKATEFDIDEPYKGFAADVMRHYDRLWPSLRPDHSLRGVSGALHRDTLLAAVALDGSDSRVRLATRKSPEDLFTPDGKPVRDDAVAEILKSFRSDRFRDRFEQLLGDLRAMNKEKPLAELALAAARDRSWGPRGIGEISCWRDGKIHAKGTLPAVPRSMNSPAAHHAVVDTNSNAWTEIRVHATKWRGIPVMTLDAARIGAPEARSEPDPALVMVLRRRDIVAWETEHGREIGYVKVIKSSDRFHVWPLRLSETKGAAETRPELGIPDRNGISFSADSFRKAKGRRVAITILGRLRDPGLPPMDSTR